MSVFSFAWISILVCPISAVYRVVVTPYIQNLQALSSKLLIRTIDIILCEGFSNADDCVNIKVAIIWIASVCLTVARLYKFGNPL